MTPNTEGNTSTPLPPSPQPFLSSMAFWRATPSPSSTSNFETTVELTDVNVMVDNEQVHAQNDTTVDSYPSDDEITIIGDEPPSRDLFSTAAADRQNHNDNDIDIATATPEEQIRIEREQVEIERESDERRRTVVRNEIERIQRANFCHFTLLCLVPTSLLFVVVLTVLGDDGNCAGLSPNCVAEPRTFVNAFTSRCICDAVIIGEG